MSDGRDTRRLSVMSNRPGNLKRSVAAAVARETLAIIGSGYYTGPDGRRVDVRDRVEQCDRGTVSYPPGTNPPESAAEAHQTQFEVTAETTLQAARRLAGEGRRACALNFASA